MSVLEAAIFSWECALYKTENKKWRYGVLQLNQSGIVFTEETKCKDGTNTHKATRMLFCNMIKITKAKSSYIYPSIVIDFNGCQVWLSSFQNRDAVFNHLEHFWRSCLLDTRARKGTDRENQELLNLAYNTQEILVDASKVLHQQGKQLAKTSRTMENLHNDMTVAERITGDIESWLGAWRVKGQFKNPHLLVKRDESPLGTDSVEYPVLYAKISQESHQPGQVLIRNENFELLNESSKSVHSFPLIQISEVKVHSPWDVTIIKRTLGKPSTNIHLTSARMPLLLKTIQRSGGRDMNFESLPKEPTTVSEIEDVGESIPTGTNHLSAKSTNPRSTVLTKEKNLSREDTDELSKVLNSMKSLAMDVGVEQDAQLKQIDDLTENVGRANARLKSTTARVDDACL